MEKLVRQMQDADHGIPEEQNAVYCILHAPYFTQYLFMYI